MWIEKLSGESPVQVAGRQVTIATRANRAMFGGQENALAFEYLYETVSQWVRPEQIEIDTYRPFPDKTDEWKNLIVTFPGATRPDEVVALSAHFDSITGSSDPLQSAPGADDNGTGVATLLEAVRLLRDYRFERTIRVIFFSGEEDGLLGSRAYVSERASDGIVSVVNIDMFGYNSDDDRCFELHIGTLPGSDQIGQKFVQVIDDHGLNLRYDYITTGATDRSDHAAFWEKGIPALTIIENLFDNRLTGGCVGTDFNPHYHKPTDRLGNLDIDYGFDIAQASLAVLMELAKPVPPLFPVQ
jgi:Zn-dependent M28 family amino/carboxypeptidase